MSREDELDKRAQGTELATFIYQGAGPQRGGVLGALWLRTALRGNLFKCWLRR